MGIHRFKLSDMIPNAWFYKLKDMSRSRKQKGSHAVKNKASSPVMPQRSPPSCSHHFPTEPYRAGMLFNSPIHNKVRDFSFTDSPRRSSKRRVQRKTIYNPSPSALSSFSTACSCHWTQPNQAESPDFYASSIESSSTELDPYECITSESDECDSLAAPHMLNGLSPDCSCRVSSSTNDIIIDMNNESFAVNPEKLDGFDPISKLGLPPILTKPARFDDQVIEASYLKCSSKVKESSRTTTPKSSANSRGIRLRVNSAKLASRKVQACARRSISSSSACKVSSNTGFPEGFAVVKSSIDPQRDFKDSMVEMIRENNIWSSEDLEDLLACYLSLNAREYHELIIKAFEQTWFDLAQLRM
ncbi:transcription repressor OFP1-like [Neltuma alba]|uniref:transcription repressor OFP1-like n=1 Tax=Neltuma alba TaxID=207710 RepID=UPI0010A58413|nr:transcription repressor OFP1-like [Prosopis alba]